MKKISLSEIRRTVRDVIRENEEQRSKSGKLRIKRLEDGLTMQDLEEKYPWVLEADIENAVIGLGNDRKIKWYSGIWHDGIWKDGGFYGGTFAGGTWEYGNFNAETFAGKTWEDGGFHGGKFTGETWQRGSFNNGTFFGKTWENGGFYGGTFAGETWKYGHFFGGTFVFGTWKDGHFLGGTFAGGTFAGGEWYSDGYKEYKKPIWESGKWKGGTIRYKGGNKESFVNPNEFFKGNDDAEYNIEQDGNYFIVTYKDYKGQENEKIFRSKEAAENFAKNL